MSPKKPQPLDETILVTFSSLHFRPHPPSPRLSYLGRVEVLWFQDSIGPHYSLRDFATPSARLIYFATSRLRRRSQFAALLIRFTNSRRRRCSQFALRFRDSVGAINLLRKNLLRWTARFSSPRLKSASSSIALTCLAVPGIS